MFHGINVSENSPTKRKRSTLGCILAAVLGIVAIIACLWLVQQFITPDVIDDSGVAIQKKKPVSNKENNGSSDSSALESPSADVVPVGPKKITA